MTYRDLAGAAGKRLNPPGFARGLDAALEEVEKIRGFVDDNLAADVRLRLFRGEGFQFEGTRY